MSEIVRDCPPHRLVTSRVLSVSPCGQTKSEEAVERRVKGRGAALKDLFYKYMGSDVADRDGWALIKLSGREET